MDQKTVVILSTVGIVLLVLLLSCGCFFAPRAAMARSGATASVTCESLADQIKAMGQEDIALDQQATAKKAELEAIFRKRADLAAQLINLQDQRKHLRCLGTTEPTVKPNIEARNPVLNIDPEVSMPSQVTSGTNGLNQVRDGQKDKSCTTSSAMMRNPIALLQPETNTILQGAVWSGFDDAGMHQMASPMYGSSLILNVFTPRQGF